MTETAQEEPTTGTEAPAKPIRLDSMDDYEELRAEHDLVLLEFFTSGCGICGSMVPVLGTVARTAPGVVATVNAGLVPDLSTEFDVRSVPTLVVLQEGEEVARLDDGFQGAEPLVELLETHANP
ncbi:thioredoxin family protein [Haloarchaeobius sp. HRN-SO-5]|uniref:thioredoxin family protein n=1 Tax=Haloarchaeobius sp. HRN-SO-5 TaxID=3446118 RepID=UPI003EB73262